MQTAISLAILELVIHCCGPDFVISWAHMQTVVDKKVQLWSALVIWHNSFQSEQV